MLALLLAVAAAGSAVLAARSAPAAPALDRATRAALLEQGADLPRLRSLLVSIGGQLVEEHYFHGATARSQANLKSASKTLISILVGIAIDRGHLAGVDQPIADFFRDELAGADAAKLSITIGDLLTMRSGLETTSNRNYGRWVQSRDWVRHVLSRPLVDRPGGRMIYSTGSTHLLSAILTRASGTSTLEFARKHLARPLGITPAGMVARSAGNLLRRQRDDADPARHGCRGRAVSARRVGLRAPGGLARVDAGVAHTPDRVAVQQPAVRLRLVAAHAGPATARTTPGVTAASSSS